MKPKIHYIVRHAALSEENGQIDVREYTNRRFEGDSPIAERKAAFEYYENYQSGVDYHRNNYTSNDEFISERTAVAPTDDISQSEDVENHPFYNLSEESRRLLIETIAFYKKYPYREW